MVWNIFESKSIGFDDELNLEEEKKESDSQISRLNIWAYDLLRDIFWKMDKTGGMLRLESTCKPKA